MTRFRRAAFKPQRAQSGRFEQMTVVITGKRWPFKVRHYSLSWTEMTWTRLAGDVIWYFLQYGNYPSVVLGFIQPF